MAPSTSNHAATPRKMIARYDRMRAAERYVRAGFRVSIVVHHTGVPRRTVRELWRRVHGEGPRPGQFPQIDRICRNRALLREASALMALYRHLARTDITQEMDLDALALACELYRDEVARPQIAPSHAWVLARDMRGAGPEGHPLVRMHRCPQCRRHYLEVAGQRYRPTCPWH